MMKTLKNAYEKVLILKPLPGASSGQKGQDR